MEGKFFEIAFLPWLGIEQSITIGPVTFWPYKKDVIIKIKDQSILEYLQKYFINFISHDGTPVQSITICSHNNEHCKILSDQEKQDIKYALDALFFSYITGCVQQSIINNSTSMFVPPSLDAFQLSYQKFRPKSNEINVSCRTGI